jgi:hypothetical protein
MRKREVNLFSQISKRDVFVWARRLTRLSAGFLTVTAKVLGILCIVFNDRQRDGISCFCAFAHRFAPFVMCDPVPVQTQGGDTRPASIANLRRVT